ncbi:hypothetical protein CUT44_27960 [Streptomyces carminius]|uniref:ATPase AAA-type core domain-containing protein n=1 Tax=Streptomyces carminius TaxID=2665496 RepID=A0A2M8LRP7_9ACTN|nr:ATP-binding protein [Streptomyces carminius]PJE94624.1 hypothetical protein CUT44_27960 [Streptomyces carminius]
MLLRFRAANVRSLRDEQELSLVVPPGGDPAGAREVELADGTLWIYPIAGIFGANASGKSNVLTAMADMRDAVMNSYARWASYPSIPREAFALDPGSGGKPSFFEVDVVIDGVRWTYGFELGRERVESEWVHSYPRGRRQEWMDRDTSRPEVYRWPGNRVRDRAHLAQRTRSNALLLSTAGTDNHPQLSPLFHWFRENLLLIDPEGERGARQDFTARRLLEGQGKRIRELLRVADLGITGTEVEWGRTSEAPTVRLLHRSASGKDVAFDWERESLGTRSWFALLGPMLLALDQGAVLLVDELDDSLHSRFAAEVIRIFHDEDANPQGAQLVFTSHDATVLNSPSGERLLEPGQAWLTEKDEAGATDLYPLSAVSPGEEENLTQSYLAGVFGGVPALLEGQIARRLMTTEDSGTGEREGA